MKKITRKHRKNIFVALIVLLIIEIAVACFINTTDKRFTRYLKRGLEADWSQEYNEENLQKMESGWDVAFIDAEYSAVESFKEKDLGNDDFAYYAKEYILALEGCKYVLEQYPGDSDFATMWAEMSPYYGQRVKALYGLNSCCKGIKFKSKKSKDRMDAIITHGWAMKKSEKLDFEKDTTKEGKTIYTTEIVNDSGYDLDYLNYEIDLLNKKGKVVDTVSLYTDELKKDDTATLSFNVVGSNIKSYVVVSASCYKKQ